MSDQPFAILLVLELDLRVPFLGRLKESIFEEYLVFAYSFLVYSF